MNPAAHPAPRRLASFALASVPGNERIALAQVAESVAALNLPPDQLNRLKTAVAEATLNAIEHGNGSRPDLTVGIEVFQSGAEVVVTIADRGGPDDTGWSAGRAEVPDLARKLEGEQRPRGWGLFLIRHMVDAMDVTAKGGHRTVRLTIQTGSPARQGPAGDAREKGASQ